MPRQTLPTTPVERPPKVRLAWVAALLGALLCSVQLGQPSEPEGFIRFRPEWVQAGSAPRGPKDAGKKHLRIGFEPVVPLSSVRITVSSLESIQIEPLTQPWGLDFQPVPAAPRRRAIGLALEKLSAASPLTLEFEVRPPREGGGIATFVVEGVTASGRPVHEAIGLTVGRPGMKGQKRGDAIVFPAVVIPEDEE